MPYYEALLHNLEAKWYWIHFKLDLFDKLPGWPFCQEEEGDVVLQLSMPNIIPMDLVVPFSFPILSD